ncbi:hypothetical protein N0V83_000600 [Neocucurbitaria cava]|uniref:Uncharacterized protein n=1 Tax=Neocucurbitaria cava TaxID=798079 RepID=A0A9W8YGQ0_9PLEO|nr:hypothetical protein N0V83_000600 [Neocucurbitaria cava]
MAEFGGNQHQGRKLMHDTTAGFRHSDQRPIPQATKSGSEQSAAEDTANEDDEEDSSTAKDDEQEGDDDEADVSAPSYGFVKHYENAIESDDEDYSGVNLVPDDDDDDMDLQEESYILQEEQQATTLLNEFRDARRLSLDSCASDNIFGATAPLNEAFISSLPDFGFAQFFEPEALPESPDPAVKRKYSDSSTKRVRFDDEVQVSDSSSSESSELDSSVFPDLFLEQDKLPPVLHQLLEMENDDDMEDMDSPVSDASFWDYGQDETRIAQADHSDDTDGDSSDDSSGYDSDMGDTTDEEDFGPDVPPRTPVQKRSVLRRPNSAPGSRAATPNPFQRSSRPTGRQIPPTRGVFIHDDSTKAIAVTNRATKTVTFYRPRATLIPWIPLNGYHSSTSSTANNSPRNSIAQLNGSDSEVSNEVFNNALGTDIMLTGIFGSAPGNDYFFGNDSVGPPEAFFPFVSIGSNGNMNIMDEDDDDSEDYEDDLNITDFMDFGSEGEDTDCEQEEDETDVPATPATTRMAPPSSTPAQPTPMSETPSNRKRTTSDVMLEHFDRGVVTAFRNNQNRYRDVSSLPQDPAVRASVSRPVRSGKSAEALITPLRKRSRANRVAKTPLHAGATIGNHSSPLSGVSKAASRLQNSVMSPPRGPPPRMGTFS